MSTNPILQFGTSRFLQAHADLFLSEAMAQGQPVGPVTVIQSSGDATRRARLHALTAGFRVVVKGLEHGQTVTRETRVTSITRAFDTATDWPEICAAAAHARLILSNTSEAGWTPQPADGLPAFDQSMSYPAKLVHLLWSRFRVTDSPVQLMPTELVSRNGDTLRARCLALAAPLSQPFHDWLSRQVFVNSLVDRIVSAPLDPAGAVAEPYALWAIESCAGLVSPCDHPAVQIVPDLVPVERRKLHILNLGHSYMVAHWLTSGRTAAFVRDVLATPALRADLLSLYAAEVLPTFAAAGDHSAAAYAAATLDRFANPFLDHRLSDIAQNHAAKLQNRIAAFLDWSATLGLTAQPRLRATLTPS